MLFGGIEAGGTKFVCAVGNENAEIISKISIPTTTPEDTFQRVYEFFDQYKLAAMGIGSFGPICINKKLDNYGYITTTPKKGWSNIDVLSAIKNRYNVPVAWTTDVNAAAYGEFKKGIAVGKDSCLYITIGTGVGAGAVVNNQLLEGINHPEMGHIKLKLHPDDSYEGNCIYHSDCFEGLASGPAIENRLNRKAQKLSPSDPFWKIEAYYIAQAIMNYTVVLSPEMIILGGGVMHQEHLFPMIRQSLREQLANYVKLPSMEEYIVGCGLGDQSGVTGCLLLAEKEFKENLSL